MLQFKDKARQKQRQQTLKLQMSQEKPSNAKVQNRNESKTAVVQPVKKTPAAKRRLLEKQEDDASLVEDYRQLKKLKNGRISQVQRMCYILGSMCLHAVAPCHQQRFISVECAEGFLFLYPCSWCSAG